MLEDNKVIILYVKHGRHQPLVSFILEPEESEPEKWNDYSKVSPLILVEGGAYCSPGLFFASEWSLGSLTGKDLPSANISLSAVARLQRGTRHPLG